MVRRPAVQPPVSGDPLGPRSGLGEDGPTHQPVEHLAMLRATPNLNLFRPADIIETAEAWELSLETADRPSVLVLSRQGLPCLRHEHSSDNFSRRGAYVLRESDGPRDVTLLATGSEVEIALKAAERLLAHTRGRRVLARAGQQRLAGELGDVGIVLAEGRSLHLRPKARVRRVAQPLARRRRIVNGAWRLASTAGHRRLQHDRSLDLRAGEVDARGAASKRERRR